MQQNDQPCISNNKTFMYKIQNSKSGKSHHMVGINTDVTILKQITSAAKKEELFTPVTLYKQIVPAMSTTGCSDSIASYDNSIILSTKSKKISPVCRMVSFKK